MHWYQKRIDRDLEVGKNLKDKNMWNLGEKFKLILIAGVLLLMSTLYVI